MALNIASVIKAHFKADTLGRCFEIKTVISASLPRIEGQTCVSIYRFDDVRCFIST